jgi:polar amino acid transport system substrate-binding protein
MEEKIMSMLGKRSLTLVILFVLISLVISACQAPTANDLLGDIKSRGTIRISTDANYAPQSVLVKDQQRAATTKCGADELTANQLEGFDIDTAKEVAKRLGVEPCFVTPDWDAITAGNWSGRWDISIGSMTITKDRQKVLNFSPAYYFTPAQVAARKGSSITSLADLSGKAVCVGSGTTYETYLSGGDVGIPDTDIKSPAPSGVKVVSLPTDSECAQAIQAGRTEFDAFMTSGTVVDEAIAQGINVEKVGGPAYVENLAVAVDRQSPKDTASLLAAVSKAITDMHSDGTLSASSQKWYNADLTVVK